MTQVFDPSAYKEGVLDEIKLDDFEVKMSGGRVAHPHKGESVWLLPYGLSLEDEVLIGRLMDAARSGADEEKVDEMLDDMSVRLAKLIVGWSITDALGNPYPQPSDGPSIKLIPTRLFMHLMKCIKGDEPEGNALSA